MKLSVLVPTYNEVECILLIKDALLDTLTQMPHKYEIVFVNNGSSDGSGELLDSISVVDSHIRVVHLSRNCGQTAALMASIDHSDGEVLIPIDGDLQNDPRDIPMLLGRLDEGFYVVSGWRKFRKDKAISRRIPSMIANWIISRMSGVPLHDYGCTLKVYRRSVLANVRLYGEMHRFIPVYAAWEGASITAMIVNHRPRRLGASKYGLGRIVKVTLELILIRFMQRVRPSHSVFWKNWDLFWLFSVLSGLWALGLKFFSGTSFISTPLPLFTAFLALSGVLCVLLGLLGELQMRIYYESQSKRHYSKRRTV